MYNLKIYAGGAWHNADLNESSSIAITLEEADIADMSVKANGSQSIELPKTKKNDIIFGYAGRPYVVTSRPYNAFDARLFYDGVEIFGKGSRLFLISSKETSYSVVLIGRSIDLYDKLKAIDLTGEQKSFFGKVMQGDTSYTPASLNTGAGTHANDTDAFGFFTHWVPVFDFWDMIDGMMYSCEYNITGRLAQNIGIIPAKRKPIDLLDQWPGHNIHGDYDTFGDRVTALSQWLKVSYRATGTTPSISQQFNLKGMTLDPFGIRIRVCFKKNMENVDTDRDYEARLGMNIRQDKDTAYDPTYATRVWGGNVTYAKSMMYKGENGFFYSDNYLKLSDLVTYTDGQGNTYRRYNQQQIVSHGNTYYMNGQASWGLTIDYTKNSLLTAYISQGYYDEGGEWQEGGENRIEYLEVSFCDGSPYDKIAGYNVYMYIAENLGLKTGLDLFKLYCQATGMIAHVEPGEITLYNMQTVVGRKSQAQDWTKYLAGVEIDFHPSYAQNNYITQGENSVNGSVDRAMIHIDDQKLDTEKDYVKLTTESPEMLNTASYWKTGNEGAVEYNEPKNPYLYNNDQSTLYLAADVLDNYSALNNLLQSYRLLKAQMILPITIMLNFDHRTPIYLQQFGRYYYVKKINNWLMNRPCEVELVQL